MAIYTRLNRSGSKRYVADTYDGRGGRDVTSHETRREAADAYAERRLAAKAAGLAPDRNMKFGTLADRFLDVDLKARPIRAKTRRNYRDIIETHLRPWLGGMKVRDVSQDLVSDFFQRMLANEVRARGTVNNIHACLSVVLKSVVGPHKLLSVHPLAGLAKLLELGTRTRVGPPPAMRAEQLATFLSAALEFRRAQEAQRSRSTPEHTADLAHDVPALAVMGWAGLRLGEALHLRPEDVDLADDVLRVRSEADKGEPAAWRPKTKGSIRRVDIAGNLRAVLEPLLARRRGERWLLYPELGNDTEAERASLANHVRHFTAGVLAHAGLPDHFTPHSLRHSFAMALLEKGVSIQYVSQQLGHASIQVTVQCYGSAWAMRAPGAVSAAADASTPAGWLDAMAAAAGRPAVDGPPDALRGRRTRAHDATASDAGRPDNDAPRGTTARGGAPAADSSENGGNNSAERGRS